MSSWFAQRVHTLFHRTTSTSTTPESSPTSSAIVFIPPPPNLPPELIHHVLTYIPRGIAASSAWTLDLLSCSLVSRTWHREALALFPPLFLRHIAFHADDVLPFDLTRLVALLTESLRTGVDYPALVDSVQLDLGILYAPRFDRGSGRGERWNRTHEDALVYLFRLARPTTLHVVIRPDPPANIGSDFRRLFSRLRPLCRAVRRLHLGGSFATRYAEVGFSKLAWFVESFAGQVERVENEGVRLSEEMRRAVSKCVAKGALAINHRAFVVL